MTLYRQGDTPYTMIMYSSCVVGQFIQTKAAGVSLLTTTRIVYSFFLIIRLNCNVVYKKLANIFGVLVHLSSEITYLTQYGKFKRQAFTGYSVNDRAYYFRYVYFNFILTDFTSAIYTGITL